ncbi:NADH-ubiquinone oxidoreductase-F iron-sulfur binding region domain-containing protein [Streptomyces sp. B6B3]|uniref:NADH-ubiquinone oxidoreductase-F iron-sulfur binding region domain-containing protein n=1 Tax=Streptomyces sp. B6B3 TaxID=3153570 RepID=UPI00325D9C2C
MSTRTNERASGHPALATIGRPRLFAGLAGSTRLDRVTHLTVHGPLPRPRLEEVTALAENIDLRGRGGAGFPFARKFRAVAEAARRRSQAPAVVVNGSEGEPSCLKDKELLRRAPHLVIDGALLAAGALGADRTVIAVTRADVERSLREAVAERPPEERSVRVVRLPERFVTGEGTALVRGLETGLSLPSGRRVRTSESGLGGAPTLLSNTETYAQLAVAARMGALPYREVGLATEPGTVLLSVAGTHVVETPTGVPLRDVLWLCGLDPGQGVLVGGYHGRWLTAEAAYAVIVSREALTHHDATLGAGAVLPLPAATCPVGEVVRVARWMADESAGQCGPCFLGLPAIADALARAADGGGLAALDAVRDRMAGVRKRGACSHPDGTAGFVASALVTFPEEFTDHALGRGCGRPVLGTLPLPDPVALDAPAPVPADVDGPRLVVDWTLCQGHALCADILPGVVRLNADGYPAAASMPVPPPARAQAVRAVRRCPALALRVAD